MPHKEKAQRNAYQRAYYAAHKEVINGRMTKRVGQSPFPELLGTMPDKELAARGGVVRSARNITSPHFKGNGVSTAMVAYYRRKAGIPAFKVAPKPPGPRPWHTLLGTMSDAKVAKIAGRTAQTVFYHRKRLGISAFRRQDEDEEQAA